MNRKKVDNRIRILIENGIQTKQRSMFFIVGNQCRNQVPILHHMLTKAQVKPKMSVLWCYKKELGFSTWVVCFKCSNGFLEDFFYRNRRHKMKQLQKSVKSGTLNLESDDPFSLFVVSTDVRYCYYNETHKILGNTYSMCILQVSLLWTSSNLYLSSDLHLLIKRSSLLGLWSTNSKFISSNNWDSWGFWYHYLLAAFNEVFKTTLHDDNGKMKPLNITIINDLASRMFTQDLELNLTMM